MSHLIKFNNTDLVCLAYLKLSQKPKMHLSVDTTQWYDKTGNIQRI